MESLKEYFPRTSTDTIAMAITFSGIPFAFMHGVFYVTPALYPLNDDLSEEEQVHNRYVRIAHYCFMVYLLVVVLGDLVLTLVVDPSCQKLTLPQLTQPGWAHCPYCKQYVPPRTHHCLTCRKCVLRRDHHCFFVGRCIGYQNHKYFMLFVLHTFVGSLYALIMSAMLVIYLNNGFSWWVLLAAIFPVMALMLQLVQIGPLVLIGTSLAFLFTLMCGALLAVHMFHLYRGQTYWESQRNVPQPKGWIRNARDILGTNWWIVWVCPFIPSPLPGDGQHYPTKDTVKSKEYGTKSNSTKTQVKRKRV